MEKQIKNYIIKSDGTVFSLRRNRIMTPVKHNQGYLCLVINGKKVLLHRLIAETFIPNPNHLPCVNHLDGDKHNNNVENLEWCTYSENHAHAFRTGLRENPTGFELGNAKLTEEDVRFIRSNFKHGDYTFGICPLARRFNVSPPIIRKIVQGKSYKSVL